MPAVNETAVRLKVGLADYERWTDQLTAAGLVSATILESLSLLEGSDSRLLAAAVLEGLHSSSDATEIRVDDVTVKRSSGSSFDSRAARLREEVRLERLSGFSSIEPWGVRNYG